MPNDNPRSTARIGGHPIHPMLVSIPIACFVLTLLSDLAYAATANMQWANMSVWLLTVGLVVSIFVVLAGLIDFFGDRRIPRLRDAWIHGLGNALALIIAIINAFVHSRDAWTSVVPLGLLLSFLTVAILACTAWFGGELVYRHGVGMASADRT